MATKINKAKKPTKEQISQWKIKADKWDKLDAKISKYYEGENNEPPEDSGDLGDIGEQAAIAFGYL